MALYEYRNPCNSSSKIKFDIERFAYDVLAYMLRICGLAEEKIPTSSSRENIYSDNFVANVGLSALPIALYYRYEWKLMFEDLVSGNRIDNIIDIETVFESIIIHSAELEEENAQCKMQHSLALYNEFILFLDLIDIKDYVHCIPNIWCHLCEEIVEKSEDSNQTFESLLTMCPDISESWIKDFIRNYAIPYGKYGVSERFSSHAMKYARDDDSSGYTSTEYIADFESEESFIETAESVNRTATLLPECSNLESNYIPDRCGSPSVLLHKPIENAAVETRTYRRTNGLNYVLQLCSKGRKRCRSQNLEVEDAFGEINLEKNSLSQENSDNKRRRKVSGKDILE